ncbi:unnamed protein product [Cunninghamella blakesleeana]
MASRVVGSTLLRSCQQRTLLTAVKPALRLNTIRAFSTSKVQQEELTNVSADPNFKSGNDSLHTYGQYLMSALPKYIQQVSVYKDELTVYVAPSALEQVMIFLEIIPTVSSSPYKIFQVWISLHVKTALK